MATKLDLVIRQGETFQKIIRWEQSPFIYVPITAISVAAPAVVTAPGHGLVSGWRAAVISANGMEQINVRNFPPRDNEYVQVTYVDANNVQLNTVNSLDYDAYTNGGSLMYRTPVDLTGFSARMTIRDRVGGTSILSLTSGAPDNRIVINNTTKTIVPTISATDTAAYTAPNGVYDFEMVSAGGIVTTLYYGRIGLNKEVTT